MQTKVNGINASSNLDKTIEIDGFMYDDDDLDELENNGLINKFYCKDCDSNNIALYSKLSILLLNY